MGNCSLKGIVDTNDCPNFIWVLTDSGRILEFASPKLAREVLQNYPGYGIFPRGQASSPLADHESLISGLFYYLLPLDKDHKLCDDVVRLTKQEERHKKPEAECLELMEPPKTSSADFVENLAAGSALEVLPSHGHGVWKVKLVINNKQLEEILSERVNTEALIEKMRTAASSAASLTPRRTKSSRVVGWKPALSNVFRAPIIVSEKMRPR